MHRLWRRVARTSVSAGLALVLGICLAHAAKKKTEEPKTQVLPLPKELPMALSAEAGTLDFHISSLLKTGKLSAQIRDSLSSLIRDTHGETIVKLRAFVGGAGDARRVQVLASEVFSDKKLPLPVLTIIQVGALGDEATQVVIEAVVATKRQVNPQGLAFFAGETAPSLEAAVAKLGEQIRQAAIEADEVQTCTCFASRLTNYAAFHADMQRAFPKAELNLVQAVRDPTNSMSTCEAVAQASARSHATPAVSLVPAHATLVFTGLQLGFGNYLDDAKAAMERLARTAQAAGASLNGAVVLNVFSLNEEAASAIRKTLPLYQVRTGAAAMQPVDGLPSLDASFGVEGIFVTGR